MRPCKDVEMLVLPFRERFEELLSALAARGAHVVVHETLRPLQRQAMLYARGRTRPGKIITNAKPGSSAHNWGLAGDLVLDVERVEVRKRAWKGKLYPDAWDYVSPEAVKVWEAVGEEAERLGLVWGGRWTKLKDFPHIEQPGWRAYRPGGWRDEVERVTGHRPA